MHLSDVRLYSLHQRCAGREGITHSLCTLEFGITVVWPRLGAEQHHHSVHPRRVRILAAESGIHRDVKRKLNLLTDKHVEWDDRVCRLFPVCAVAAIPRPPIRGSSANGVTGRTTPVRWRRWNRIREDLNENAPRALMAVIDPGKTGYRKLPAG